MWAAWGRAAPSCPHADCCSTFSKATGSLRMSRGHCVDPALLVPCPKCPCGACWLWGLSPRSLETPGRLLLVGMELIPTEEERPAGRGLGTMGHGGVQRGEVAVSPAGHHPWALQGPSLCPPQPWAHVCSAGDGDADPGQRSCEPPHKHLFLVPEAPRGRRAPRKVFGGRGVDGHGGDLLCWGSGCDLEQVQAVTMGTTETKVSGWHGPGHGVSLLSLGREETKGALCTPTGCHLQIWLRAGLRVAVAPAQALPHTGACPPPSPESLRV